MGEDKKGFGILNWWKDNSTRLPILYLLASDLLVIPISLVASESAFSAGGGTLDDSSTLLTPNSGEASCLSKLLGSWIQLC